MVNVAELRRVLRERFRASAAQVAAVEALLRQQVVVPNPRWERLRGHE
jgi:hypothetical protein